MVEVVCGVRIGVAIGCVGTRGEGVVTSGGSASVADGGGVRWKDCSRCPNGISGDLQGNLPYCLPFTRNIRDVFNCCGMKCFVTSVEPELGSVDFVGKSGTHMNVCRQMNGD